MLLKVGARPDIPDSLGKTASQYYMENKNSFVTPDPNQLALFKSKMQQKSLAWKFFASEDAIKILTPMTFVSFMFAISKNGNPLWYLATIIFLLVTITSIKENQVRQQQEKQFKM
jgi:hypothetical protein